MDCTDVATSQGMPAATEAERGEDRSSLEGARPHQMSDCWPLGRDNKYPWCGNLIAATGDEQMLAEALLLANKKASTSEGERLCSS